MHTFLARRRSARRSPIGRVSTARARERLRPTRPRVGSQDGFLLIEVIVSALLVALIVIATFTGFDVTNRVAADQRYHGQAAVLAAQSQEQLRTDAAETLNELQITPHVYKQTVGGTTYTITEKVYFINDTQKSSGCSAVGGGASKSHGDYVEIVSSVTWPQLVKAKRPAVSQFSYITPPTGSALEVDVTNGGTPELPVEGVTAKVNTAEAVTGASGCLIFGGIPSTTASLEVYKVGYVTKGGEFNVVAKEVSVAPNVIIHYPVILAEAGKITAEFTYKGKSTYEYKNSKGENIVEPVTGDTFVVHNAEMGVAPEFEVGSTAGAFNKEFEWEVANGTYAATATTPAEPTHYPKGNLFPLKGSWGVYAGDCPENDALNSTEKIKEEEKIKDGESVVTPGGNIKTAVSMSRDKLAIWKGKEASKNEGLTEESFPVKIMNVACEKVEPDNEPLLNVVRKTETLTGKQETEKKWGLGLLPHPFQPFGGPYTLCLYNAAAKRQYTATYENNYTESPTINIYLKAEVSYAEGATKEREVKVAIINEQLSNKC